MKNSLVVTGFFRVIPIMRKSEGQTEIDDVMAHGFYLLFRERVIRNVIEISYANDKF